MGLLSNLFGKTSVRVVYGKGHASAPPRFTRDAYEQETVRAIIDCIAAHTAKAEAMHVVLDENGRVKEIKRNSPYVKLLNMQPNPFMTGYDLKYKMITQLEANTTTMAYVEWEGMTPHMILPVPNKNWEIYPIEGGGYAVKFVDDIGDTRYLDLEDVIVLRKFFNSDDVVGEGNEAVYETLSMLKASNDGLVEALTVSNKIRGLLKHKKAMLDPEDVARSAEQFSSQYRKAAANGGTISVDAQQEYVPLSVTPWAANAPQMKEIRGNLLRYWRISEAILTSDYTESQWQAFYESVIEPRLLQMGQAFTVACFTPNERNHGNRIIFTTSTLMHTSMQTKINILRESKEVGLFTDNELREMFGYAPVGGGDRRKVSLNYVNADKQDEYQLGEGEVQDDGQPDAAGTQI